METLSEHEKLVCDEVLKSASVGHLGLIDSTGYPRVIPLNFVLMNGIIYFHSGVRGEKYALLLSSPKVTFSVEIPYALIPSYWNNPERACSITHLFKSVLIRGYGQIVKDPNERMNALQALMDKYQQERYYLPLDLKTPIYSNAFKKVAIFLIWTETISVKINLGQSLESSKLNQIIENLKKRDAPLDRDTLIEIEKWQSDKIP